MKRYHSQVKFFSSDNKPGEFWYQHFDVWPTRTLRGMHKQMNSRVDLGSFYDWKVVDTRTGKEYFHV